MISLIMISCEPLMQEMCYWNVSARMKRQLFHECMFVKVLLLVLLLFTGTLHKFMCDLSVRNAYHIINCIPLFVCIPYFPVAV